MDVLIMKNNKLPLKERYNNFIQKYPKFWLTLIYGVLMLALAITMFIVALDPPDNKTASADSRQAGSCPDSQYNKDFYFATNLFIVSSEDCFDIASHLSSSSNFDYYTVGASLLVVSPGGNPVPLSLRYLVIYKYYTTDGTGNTSRANIYFSNSIQDPRNDGYPSDRVSCLSYDEDNATYNFNNLKYVFINGFYLKPYNHRPLDRIADFVQLSELIQENGCWAPIGGSCSPDDLKAEYDKGHTDGYTAGYDKGKIDGANLVSVSPITYLLSPVSSLLGTPIWGQFTIGSLFSVVLFVACVLIFLRMFAGG